MPGWEKTGGSWQERARVLRIGRGWGLGWDRPEAPARGVGRQRRPRLKVGSCYKGVAEAEGRQVCKGAR